MVCVYNVEFLISFFWITLSVFYCFEGVPWRPGWKSAVEKSVSWTGAGSSRTWQQT